jgi:isopentenyl diphosphate isomerase/L-lactate dehydrogenase-like FMN-dependent dehydrogenase
MEAFGVRLVYLMINNHLIDLFLADQLYWPGNHEVTLSLLDRAWNQGIRVLVVTLDTFVVNNL